MKVLHLFTFAAIMILGMMMLDAAESETAKTPTPQERLDALKQSLAQSQELLKQYEWIETTVVSLKGEEKVRIQNRCYYGADGNLQKVLVVAPPPEDKKRGLRGKIAETKKAEMTEYMQSAVDLVKSYVPPDPVQIEASKNAGKMSITPAESSVRFDFLDYQKKDDTLGIEIDIKKDTLLGLTVATWLENAKDKVAMACSFGLLNDGTLYPAEINISAPSQSLKIKITNSGYKKQ